MLCHCNTPKNELLFIQINYIWSLGLQAIQLMFCIKGFNFQFLRKDFGDAIWFQTTVQCFHVENKFIPDGLSKITTFAALIGSKFSVLHREFTRFITIFYIYKDYESSHRFEFRLIEAHN